MSKFFAILIAFLFLQDSYCQQTCKNLFPDRSPISDWFSKTSPRAKQNQRIYKITDFGVINDSNLLQTKAIQATIDEASKYGGIVCIPKGVFRSGALFFKPKTSLYLEKGAVLKGSNNIEDYPKLPSRMEGQNLEYFAALVNAYSVDSFVITGKGIINGDGLKYWEAFWRRRKENPQCTNLEVSRPRLIFIQHSKNVSLSGISLINSGFWTCHLYKCSNIKLSHLYIFSPKEPIKAPSTDAVDIDACQNVHIFNCYLSVNDDAVALKGGKGPWADKDTANGENTNILIENCTFGFCHSAITCGSEAIHNKNILIRNCKVKGAERMLWIKMRPDTPQKYEYICMENIRGQANSFIYIKPWTQFFDLKGRTDVPLSYCENILLKSIKFNCSVFFDVNISQYDILSNFTFQNLNISAKDTSIDKSLITNLILNKVKVRQLR